MSNSDLNFLNENLPIFIIHDTKLINRKKFINDQLIKYNIKATFITEYDKDNLTTDDKSIFDENKLTSEQISYICKHFYIYTHIIKNNIQYAVILQDNTLLCDNFVNNIVTYFKQLPDNWDFLFFGSGFNLHVPKSIINNNINVYLKSNNGIGKWSSEVKDIGWPVCAGSSRCSDSYIINHNFIKKIFWYNKFSISKISKPLDLYFNILFRDNNANIYWGEPSLTKIHN
tara:strand:+ start:1220 stop:1906 length:687 start_codon:yes stop_codon:yes gene_type:complete